MTKRAKIAILLLSLILLILVSTRLLVIKASTEYRVMAYTEMLKGHIEKEYQVYSNSLFDDVKVVRCWYNFHPSSWIFEVKLTLNDETLLYQYKDGIFFRVSDK